MNQPANWWKKPRKISVIVDNDSWILPYAHQLIDQIISSGDEAQFFSKYDDLPEGDIAFLLGCIKIAKPETLKKHKINLVVHESDLPKGRGFSPLTWQILEGKNKIPICLIEAMEEVDSGKVFLRDTITFQGHELLNELRNAQGEKTISMCLQFLDFSESPIGEEQYGEPSTYFRRRPENSLLDVNLTLAQQFNLLRVVDNQRYPAFFEYKGHRYKLTIEKDISDKV